MTKYNEIWSVCDIFSHINISIIDKVLRNRNSVTICHISCEIQRNNTHKIGRDMHNAVTESGKIESKQIEQIFDCV